MLRRVLSGVGVAVVLLTLLLWGGPWPCLVLALALSLLAQDELLRLARIASLPTECVVVPVFGMAYLVAVALESPCLQARLGGTVPTWVPSSREVLTLAPLAFLAAGVLRRRPEKGIERFAVALGVFWYGAVLPSFLVRLTLRFNAFDAGRALLVYGLFVVKMNDVGAYFIGMRFGRGGRRLIPEISPAKSVAGLFGGYVFALVTSLLFAAGAALWGDGRLGGVPLSIAHAVALGLLLPTAGTLGDLAESLFKRSAGVKDSASRVPGLGGVLDMVDSPFFAAPLLYLYVVRFL